MNLRVVTGFGEGVEKASGHAPTISLRNGAEIPALGIGTSPLRGDDSMRQIRPRSTPATG